MKKKVLKLNNIIPIERIERQIYVIREQKVIFDSDLAELYRVSAKVLNQAVKRNITRFPIDFMFQLNTEETKSLRSQFVTLEKGRGRYSKYAHYVFTEHGVAMLASVLTSERAVQMNIMIVRAFIKMREYILTNKELAARLEKVEVGQKKHTSVITLLANEIDALKQLPPEPPRKPIGFIVPPDDK